MLTSPPGEGSNLAAQATPSGRQEGAHLPPEEGSSLVASQTGSQASQASQVVTSQAGAHLPPGEGSNLVAQATQSGRQAGAHLPPREGRSLVASQVGIQASKASQAGAVLSPGEGSNSAVTQVVPPFVGDGASSQAGSEVTTHTPAGKSSSQAGNNLPTSQAVSQGTRCSARQRVPRLPRGTAMPPRQTVLLPRKAISHLTP